MERGVRNMRLFVALREANLKEFIACAGYDGHSAALLEARQLDQGL